MSAATNPNTTPCCGCGKTCYPPYRQDGFGLIVCSDCAGEPEKPISEMTREEVRAELEKNGLLKSTEWFSARILPMLLEDKRLRESLAAKDAEIDRLEQKLQAANDEIVTRGIEIERVLRALAAKDAEIEQLKGLLQEWLAAYLEEFGELDPTCLDRLDRAYLATFAAVRAVQEEKPCPGN